VSGFYGLAVSLLPSHQQARMAGILLKIEPEVSIVTRVFVICAPKDEVFFVRLTDQARSAKLPVEFDHTLLKQSWVPHWKAQCRTRIYPCGGAIVLISKNTREGGIGWELECARAFEIPMLGVHVDQHERGSVPKELLGWGVIEWNWPEIARFIQSLTKGSSASAW
jgi:hypothetical protein